VEVAHTLSQTGVITPALSGQNTDLANSSFKTGLAFFFFRVSILNLISPISAALQVEA